MFSIIFVRFANFARGAGNNRKSVNAVLAESQRSGKCSLLALLNNNAVIQYTINHTRIHQLICTPVFQTSSVYFFLIKMISRSNIESIQEKRDILILPFHSQPDSFSRCSNFQHNAINFQSNWMRVCSILSKLSFCT